MVEGSVLIKKKLLRQTKLFKFRQAFKNIAMGAVSLETHINRFTRYPILKWEIIIF